MYTTQEYSNNVASFKSRWCNENPLISEILAGKLDHYINETVLDVGAGLGDIASVAFPHKKAICIDLVIPTNNQLIQNQNHHWIKTDFFNYSPTESIQTLLLCHSQQFLDEDPVRLFNKLQQVNAKHIILVQNSNDDVFGELVRWTTEQFPQSNPEVNIKSFVPGYKVVEEVAFTAHLQCDSFQTLAEQIGYLMVNKESSFLSAVLPILKTHLTKPHLPINEIIEVYERIN